MVTVLSLTLSVNLPFLWATHYLIYFWGIYKKTCTFYSIKSLSGLSHECWRWYYIGSSSTPLHDTLAWIKKHILFLLVEIINWKLHNFLSYICFKWSPKLLQYVGFLSWLGYPHNISNTELHTSQLAWGFSLRKKKSLCAPNTSTAARVYILFVKNIFSVQPLCLKEDQMFACLNVFKSAVQ